MTQDIDVQVCDDVDAANRATAEAIVGAAEAALREREAFVIALSGGKSPQPVYRLLAGEYRDRIDWARTHVWFGDERCVLPDDRASNFGMAKASLLDHVAVPEAQVHRLAGEMLPGEAAWVAHQELRAFAEARGEGPVFDVMMIGAGPDGHTASLFPEANALEERERLVVATAAPAQFEVRDRLTMTLPALNDARLVLLLATGRDKRAVLHAAHDAGELPVGRVRGLERTLWIVDRAAWA
jgi:6-phosphogluconolactonase